MMRQLPIIVTWTSCKSLQSIILNLLLAFCCSPQLIWEKLYNTQSSRQIGTLYYFRQKFGRMNVPNQVKKNYSGAEALILQVSRAYICEAFMTWAGMDTLHSVPTSHIVPKKSAAQEEKTAYIEEQIRAFVDNYCLLDADVEQMWTLSESQRRSQREAANVMSSNETVAPSAELYRPGR